MLEHVKLFIVRYNTFVCVGQYARVFTVPGYNIICVFMFVNKQVVNSKSERENWVRYLRIRLILFLQQYVKYFVQEINCFTFETKCVKNKKNL